MLEAVSSAGYGVASCSFSEAPPSSCSDEGAGPRDGLYPSVLLQEVQMRAAWEGPGKGEIRTRRGWHK